MRRLTLILTIMLSDILAVLPLSAQESGSLSVHGSMGDRISSQLSGHSHFEPDNRAFIKQASKEIGIFPAVIITSDRLTRGGRIGTAGRNMIGEDGKIHEGLSAYRLRHVPERTEAMEAVVKPLAADGSGSGMYASKEYGFVDYLIGNGMGEEALKLLSSPSFHPSDTLSYLRGWTDYSCKLLQEASAEFSAVPEGSSFYDKSIFFNLISNAHLGRLDQCSSLLDSYTGPHKELEALERAGLALMMNDSDAYLDAARSFTFSNYILSESETMMKGFYGQKSSLGNKSPLLAAAASAIVPGLGKIYAGELGEGIASFAAVGSLAAVTAENWIKNGPTNWKTILFGAAGAIFHIGNIYGSYVSVGIHNDFIENELDTAILYNMHVPLRSFFD